MSQSFRQLELLLRLENDKEHKFAQDLQSAQSFYQASQTKLKEVQGYKLDYLKQLQHMGSQGLAGGNYQHYQRFIVQLEAGIKAQLDAVDMAKQVVEQRRGIWLEQRTKVQAVETVLTNKKQAHQAIMDKHEQNLADEFASQKYIRSRL